MISYDNLGSTSFKTPKVFTLTSLQKTNEITSFPSFICSKSMMKFLKMKKQIACEFKGVL